MTGSDFEFCFSIMQILDFIVTIPTGTFFKKINKAFV